MESEGRCCVVQEIETSMGFPKYTVNIKNIRGGRAEEKFNMPRQAVVHGQNILPYTIHHIYCPVNIYEI